MDRITRFARPHCYDASQGPLSFLDSGRRSRSTPRMNIDPITRKACPERQGSDSGPSPGFANSRLRAQSTDSLTWRRTARVRQQHLAPRQHMSHGELRTDSTERLANTVVINFSNSQIGEPNNVFAPSSPVVCNTAPRTVVNASSGSLSTVHTPAVSTSSASSAPAAPPRVRPVTHTPPTPPQSAVDPEPEVRPRRVAPPPSKVDSTDSESKVRPVVETIAVHGRRLSYSRAAAADRLNSSDLDDLARQIGLLDDSPVKPESSQTAVTAVPVMAKRTPASEPNTVPAAVSASPGASSAASSHAPSSSAEASSAKDPREGRSRKGKMGWLGGLFRRLRHWPDHSSSSSSSPPGSDAEGKKQRRRARSLPPSSKRSASNSQASGPPSCNSPSTAGGSPTPKKLSMDNSVNAETNNVNNKGIGEKPIVVGVSRSRTVDDIERARAFGSNESTNNMVLPHLEASRVEDSSLSTATTDVKDETLAKEIDAAPSAKVTEENSAPAERRTEKPTQDSVDLSMRRPPQVESKADVAPKYCNLAVLAYGYRPPNVSGEVVAPAPTKPALEDRTNMSDSADRSPAAPCPSAAHEKAAPGDKSSPIVNSSRASGQSSESVENARPEANDKAVRANGHTVKAADPDSTVQDTKRRAEEVVRIEETATVKDEAETREVCDDAFPVVPDLASMPRVRINIEPCERSVDGAAEKAEAGVVFRRKKAVSCSETTDSLPRSSLIMLAVSQASPRPKTEFVPDSDMPTNFKNCPMSVSQHEDMEPSGPEERDGFYYLRLAAQVEAKFRERMRLFEVVLENEASLSEEAAGFLRSVLGKANLLLTDKFAQLRGLCQQNISEQVDSARASAVVREGGFATRNSDLDGYWALVQLPVEDLEAQFRQLDAMRENGWRLPEVANGSAGGSRKATPAKRRTVSAPARKKKTPTTSSASPAKDPSAAAQARQEARKRLEAAKREAAAKMKATAAASGGDSDVFIFV